MLLSEQSTLLSKARCLLVVLACHAARAHQLLHVLLSTNMCVGCVLLIFVCLTWCSKGVSIAAVMVLLNTASRTLAACSVSAADLNCTSACLLLLSRSAHQGPSAKQQEGRKGS
jgi:hypothetical protein